MIVQCRSMQHDVEMGQPSSRDRELTQAELYNSAMAMYNLDQSHVIHDPRADTKVSGQEGDRLICTRL